MLEEEIVACTCLARRHFHLVDSVSSAHMIHRSEEMGFFTTAFVAPFTTVQLHANRIAAIYRMKPDVPLEYTAARLF